MAFENVSKYKEEIYRCNTCGRCARGPWDPYQPDILPLPVRQCPIYENHGFMAYAPEGIMLIIKELMEGKLKPTDSMVAALYECLLCRGCNVVCAAFHLFPLGEMECADIFQALRADLVNMGIAPPKAVKKITDHIQEKHNRLGTDRERDAWAKGMKIPPTGTIMLFAGCTAAYENNEVIQSLAKILQQAGVDFGMLKDEWCCGALQLDSGLVEPFKVSVKHNIDAIKKADAKKVVCVCADGYKALKYDYPKFADGDLGFQVLHSTELLSALISEKKIKFNLTIELGGKAIYFDPCLLARPATRVIGNYDEPRQIINSIPGIELVETYGNKQNTNCCGRPIVASAAHDVYVQAGEDRIRDAQAADAKCIITGCVNCKQSLTGAAKRLHSDIKVIDIAELVAQALGIKS